MRIGVCIPGHANHLQYLQKCLVSIEQQTVKPTVISISISSHTGILPPIQCSIPLKISVTPNAACAGKNRNIAAKAIEDEVDILSFVDMDDWMHPQRLEIAAKAFAENAADCFLHFFEVVSKQSFHELSVTDYKWIEPTQKLFTDCFSASRDCICGRVEVTGIPEGNNTGSTKGHITESVKAWRSSPFPEGYGIGEDCENLYRLYEKGFKPVYCPDKLSLYFK
jgi:hypothetical protein